MGVMNYRQTIKLVAVLLLFQVNAACQVTKLHQQDSSNKHAVEKIAERKAIPVTNMQSKKLLSARL